MGIYNKIYNIMQDTKALKKDMSVAGQYKAISEKVVLNEIKPLLKKHGVILFPVDAEISQHGKVTQIVAKYKIVDIETGESETLATVGNGADTQDKGSGKAWTYAYKCLLQKTFCMFSGEDTDNTHSDNIIPKATTEQKDNLCKVAAMKDITYDMLNEYATKKYRKAFTKINQEEYEAMLTYVESK